MPFEIRHGVDPGVLTQLAAQIGSGEKDVRRQSRQDQLRALAAQRMIQRSQLRQNQSQFEDELQFRGDQAELDRDFQRENLQTGFDEQDRINQARIQQAGVTGQFGLDRERLRQGGYTQRQMLDATIDNPAANAQLKQLMQSGNYTYTPQQTKRYNQLQGTYQQYANSNLPDKIKQPLLHNLLKEMGNIKFQPSSTLTEEPTTEEVVKQKTWADPNGVVWALDQNGVPKTAHDPTKTQNDFQKQIGEMTMNALLSGEDAVFNATDIVNVFNQISNGLGGGGIGGGGGASGAGGIGGDQLKQAQRAVDQLTGGNQRPTSPPKVQPAPTRGRSTAKGTRPKPKAKAGSQASNPIVLTSIPKMNELVVGKYYQFNGKVARWTGKKMERVD